MKVLITGSAGFVGTHLIRELIDHGYEVEGHDVSDGNLVIPGVFSSHLDEYQPDQVIHLAAQVGRAFGEDDLAHTVAANVTMTALIAHACGQAGVPVLYSSTSEVYGDQRGEVCREQTPLVLAHNLYGVTKLAGEDVLRLYAPDGLQIVRLSMPAGPGAPPGRGRRALDNFLWAAHHRMPITVHRGAERSWCHVSDTVAGIRLVLEKGERSYTGYPSRGVYNVGRDDCPLSMEALARMCCDLAGAPHSLIELVDPPSAQTVVKRLSTEKLRGLGWEPERELPEILSDIYAHVQNYDRDGHWLRVAA
jgi:nucleoside-diphosphate-sugar epimerase